MPRRPADRPRLPGGDPAGLRPRRRQRLPARLGGQPPVSGRPHPRGGDLHDGHLRRRARGGPLHLQHRHQLPLGGDHRPAPPRSRISTRSARPRALVDHIIPGRSRDARPPTEKELRSTMLLRLPLAESSAKVRTGWPLDEEEDYDLDDLGRGRPLRHRRRGAWSDPALRSASRAATTWSATGGRSPPCGEELTMCGVVGLLLRDRALEPRLGALLVPMIEALDERGPDSSGIAVYADRPRRPERRSADPAGLAGQRRAGGLGRPRLRAARRLRPSGADVHRFGAGTVVDLPEPSLRGGAGPPWPPTGPRSGCSAPAGTCGCSRTPAGPRTPAPATASPPGRATWPWRTPGWPPSPPSPSCTPTPSCPTATCASCTTGPSPTTPPSGAACRTTGVHFDSDNDSEVAARFLAGRLGPGDDLEEATRWVMKEMDGFFTLVITTADEHVGRARRLRLQAGRRGRDRRGTWPWRRSTGPWPSCPASRTPPSSSPTPRRSTRGAAEADASRLGLRRARHQGRQLRPCAGSSRRRMRRVLAPRGRHNLAVGLAAPVGRHRRGQRRLLPGWPVRGQGRQRSRHRRQRIRRLVGRREPHGWHDPGARQRLAERRRQRPRRAHRHRG